MRVLRWLDGYLHPPHISDSFKDLFDVVIVSHADATGSYDSITVL